MKRRKKSSCDKNDKDYMMRYVRGLLQRRPYPISELRKKLLAKGCDPKTVDEVMVKLKEIVSEGMLTNEFLESLYIGACRKGKGPLWFKHRALASGLAEDVVNSYISRVNWEDALRVCVDKARARYGVDFYKIKSYLYRNGFDSTFWDMATKFLKEG